MIEITEERLQKVYDESCNDVKKVLQGLFGDNVKKDIKLPKIWVEHRERYSVLLAEDVNSSPWTLLTFGKDGSICTGDVLAGKAKEFWGTTSIINIINKKK